MKSVNLKDSNNKNVFTAISIQVAAAIDVVKYANVQFESVVAAAGGTVHHASFVRGPMDIILDCELPDQDTMMGLVAAVIASGSIEEAVYLECVDGDPIWAAARKIGQNYTPANA